MNLNQVTIQVSQVEISIEFYEKFGLKLIVRASDYARFECPEGDATFSLHQVSRKPGPGVWIYFEMLNVDLIVEGLLEKGIAVEEMPENKPWLWREARVLDPDGNLLILYHAGDNRKNPPWKIK